MMFVNGVNNTTNTIHVVDLDVDLDLYITCRLCNNQIFEPKTLPCQHSFCFRCLNAWGLKNFYNQRGCECPCCGVVFPSLPLNQIMDDEKVRILQQIAARQSAQNTISSSSKNPPSKVEDDMIDATSGNDGLHSAPPGEGSRLNKFLGLDDSEGEDMGGVGVDPDSSGDSSLEDEIDGEVAEYLSSDDSSSEEEEGDSKTPRPMLEVVQDLFNDEDIDDFRFNDIFLKKLQIVKTVDIRAKKELKDPFVHDMSMTRDGNLFVVDINNNLVKCCDSEGLTLKKTSKKLTFNPIRICELYTGELLVVEMTKRATGKLSSLKRSLTNKDATHKTVIRSVKKICVVRQMPEDRTRFYCGDSLGYVHRMSLKNPESYHKFHSVLPRVYHLAAANSLVAVNDGNLDGATSKIVRIFDEEGNLQWSYSGTVKHPFQYHGDMVFHGDYLIICDFWASKMHILFLPNETPAVILDLKRDLGLVFPSAILTTRDHRLVLAAQKKTSKKNLIYTIEYLHEN